MHTFDYIVLTPPGLDDVSVAVAASRAGASGIVDLEFASSDAAARHALAALADLSAGSCGVRLGLAPVALARAVLDDLPSAMATVVLRASLLPELLDQVEPLRVRGVRILLEVVQRAEATPQAVAAVDGLIARGLEAGGWIGDETTFILLQHLLATTDLPVWAHGGIGLHTAAACAVAGAAGVVLDSQVALARECVLPAGVRAAIARMDGSETVCVGEELGAPLRIYARPGSTILEHVRSVEASLHADARPLPERLRDWAALVREQVGWHEGDRRLWLIGQDAAFASGLGRRFATVGGIVGALRDAVRAHVDAARRERPLAEGSPLARSHGTRYPILQGPMTRVSDVPAFADAVAEGGALPFLALALLRAPEVRTTLAETRRRLGDRPWGVGILGFVPLELRQEQLEVVREFRPSYALIAGGRPDQALALEREGIATYLHVPSPGLLRMFVENGARRFVFEGRECGGHVGPRSSFVLWNTMIDVLLDTAHDREVAAACHVVFAGGVHDALSASMVAAMAAPLAAKGMKVGVLLGTGYLFTHEAVTSGAITRVFQEEAVACRSTVLLESGPGHATRCARTEYADTFESERRRLRQEARSPEDMRDTLEGLNLGRLRIASKALAHNAGATGAEDARLVAVGADEQRRQGMFMIGQLATLRRDVCSIAELHREVATGGSARLEAVAQQREVPEPLPAARPCDIAIVGMSCLLPKAPSLDAYWANIVNAVNAITEIPADRFDWRRYYDPDLKARDKINSKWGGFLDPVPFDAARYGMPPASLPSIEPVQLLVLEATRRALDDAGYAEREFPRARTGVIVGVGGGVGDLGQQYGTRAALPTVAPEVGPEVWDRLPEWTEDSFAGIIANVTAGRVANRFDLHGVNYTVDAACASSLAALYAGTRELETGAADVMLVAGADTVQNPFGYLCFSKTRALSPHGRCRAFDESADGTVLGEGVAVVVLKRLADAERDGDRIYAVIKAVAGASDGRGLSMTAPSPDGQVRVLERAYRTAGLSPASIGLVEAHGTGTVAGDRAEIEALSRVLGPASEARQWCAVGSVKSMIGHTKCVAGLAGLIKATKALYHKVLPPTIGVERPNTLARLEDGPFYVNSEARPWLQFDPGPRRAGVSSFGFGGTNFHVVVEEYVRRLPCEERAAVVATWPCELFLLVGRGREELRGAVEALLARARAVGPTSGALRDVACAAWEQTKAARSSSTGQHPLRTLAIVARSIDDLREKLGKAHEHLQASDRGLQDPAGLYLAETPLAATGAVAFLFPGQGSQYPDMLRDVCLHFDEAGACVERASRVLGERLAKPLGAYVFPPPRFSPEAQRACEDALTQTNVAQPGIGATSLAMFRVLVAAGVRPDAVAGHSYGEYAALCAAEALDEDALYELSELRGRVMAESGGEDLGTMAAVQGAHAEVTAALAGDPDVWVANVNTPEQTVISGTRAGVASAIRGLETLGMASRSLPVACAFHSPLMANAARRFGECLRRTGFRPPRLPVFSNTTATRYEDDPAAIRDVLARHLESPVRFVEELEAMYQAGCRVFVEVGPRSVLTGFARQAFKGRPFLAVATDVPGRPGLEQLLQVLGRLAAHGVPVSLDRLFAGRTAAGAAADAPPAPSPTTWLVTGGGVRRLGEDRAVRPAPRHEPPARRLEPAPGVAPGEGPSPQPAHSRARPMPPAAARQPPSPLDQAPPAARNGAGDEVIAQFQRTMARFLEVQRNVMLAYLGRGRAAEAGLAAPVERVAAAAPAVTTAPVEPVAPAVEQPSPVALDPLRSEIAPEAAIDEHWLRAELLRIASDRTGYPDDMLDLDANMEADLGIDSIKRVEILGALQDALPPGAADRVLDALETLTRAKTLRAVVEQLTQCLAAASAPSPPPTAAVPAAVHAVVDPVPQGTNGTATAAPLLDRAREDVVPRFVVAAVEQPVPSGTAAPRLPSGVVVITTDPSGAGARVAEELRGRGVRAVLLREHAAASGRDDAAVDVALEDPQEVAHAVARIRAEHGPIGGVIHLAALGRPAALDQMDMTTWRSRMARDVKGLYHLLRAVGDDLVGGEGAFVLAATGLGGRFGCDGLPAGAFPGDGGIAGLVKTLGVEWLGVRCKVVDLEPVLSAETAAARIASELTVDDGELEVGWNGTTRTVLRVRPAALDAGGPPATALEGCVLLVTGGARGITSAAVEELGRRYRPTLVLVGRQPQPAETEPAETASLTAARDLKAALIAGLRRDGATPSPAEVEQRYRRLLRDREMRARLAAIAATGATVEYHQVDVRDGEALAALVADVYRRHGTIDGVIHGAGLIEDKLLREKLPESFERVFDTKVDSAFVLARTLRPESLRFLLLYSSVAGRWGNRGQADYVAANEVVNKLALHLDAHWPGRIAALNWGPWGGTGMVSEAVAQQFAERGVHLVPWEGGARACADEIAAGRKGEVEIVLGRGPWEDPAAHAPAATVRHEAQAQDGMTNGAGRAPLLVGARLSAGAGGVVEVTRAFDPDQDRYLRHHCLDGKLVVPAAIVAELMMEVVQQGWPDWLVVEIRAFRVLRGLVLDRLTKPVRIVARAQTHVPGEALTLDVGVELFEEGQSRPSYRATIELGQRFPDVPALALLDPAGLSAFSMPTERLYSEWLFHGPSFQCIADLRGVSAEGLLGVLRPSRPEGCLASHGGTPWLVDPIVLDGGLQLALLWMRETFDVSALPSSFGGLRRFAPAAARLLRCDLRAQPGATAHVARFDVMFSTHDGKPVMLLEDLEATGSRALNRMMGWRGEGALATPLENGAAADAGTLGGMPTRERPQDAERLAALGTKGDE